VAAELKAESGVTTRLVAGSGGVFDVTVGGKLVFSKHQTGRFPEPGEVLRLIRAELGPAG